MTKKSIIAKMVFQDGKRDEAIAAMAPMMEHVKSEPGTLVYHMLKDLGDAKVHWMPQKSTSHDGLDAHLGSDAMQALGPAIGGFLDGAPELNFTDPVGGKGL